MKRANISNNVIRRLPRYLRKLDDLAYHGINRISSGELGKQMGLTASQIRQDFSCFGEFGQQGYGYNIEKLREQISCILGMDRSYNIILVGVGNLGHALIENYEFEKQGFNLIGAFDIDPDLIGSEINGVFIYSSSLLPEFTADHKVDIAVLSVPRRQAENMAVTLAECGVRAIWNFTNVDVDPQNADVLVENIHFSDSLLALSYYLRSSDDSEMDE